MLSLLLFLFQIFFYNKNKHTNMPSGNGCRAAITRARKAKENEKSGPSSAEDRKKQEAANFAIQCDICKTGFSKTVKQLELQQHLDAKHPKTDKSFSDVFPNWAGAASS